MKLWTSWQQGKQWRDNFARRLLTQVWRKPLQNDLREWKDSETMMFADAGLKSFKLLLIGLLIGLVVASLFQSATVYLTSIPKNNQLLNGERAQLDQFFNFYPSSNENNERRKMEEESANSSIEVLKKMTTEELGQLVIRNCRLTNQFREQTPKQTHDEAASVVIPNQESTKNPYMKSLIKSSDGKFLAICLNTKSGSTFLQYKFLKKEKQKLPINNSAINTFMIIREPMHRLLSAYLDKFKNCRNHQSNICGPWKSFAQNVAKFINRKNETESNLFNATLEEVNSYNVTFSDFVSYVIHMYLQNDGNIMNPKTDILTPEWTWSHWQSVVQDNCRPCSNLWKHVVLFENFAEHFKQVIFDYPDLMRNASQVADIKPVNHEQTYLNLFESIPDDQLWFLGNVMYSMDYAILPYNFADFCNSINRSLPLEHI